MSEEQKILKLLKANKSRSQGFALLMEQYNEVLYWHIRRLVVHHEDAQDILQETFINVYRYIENFKGESSLKTWLYRIATNESLRHYKKKKLETASYDQHNRLIEIFEGDSTIDFDSIEAKLQKAILSLPQKQRVAFNLRYYDELSYQEIADITGQSIATLKTNYHYAQEKIKEYMLDQI